ncbi:MAG: PDZ domain-containing protein [Sedimentisphaerales bacterium]|nr:PDZ domain-containing protein [Sedimentisphaerales bacterium]
MKSKITKFAAAAVIILAAIIVFNQTDISIDVANIALADVAKKIEQTKNCVFNKTTIISSEDNNTNTFDSLVYYTKAAIREDIYDNEKITNQVYVDFSEGIIVGIEHKTKLFRKIDLTDEDIENEKLSSSISPENIVNLMLSEGKYKKLGRKTVDGVLSEGFEFDDKRALLSMDKDKVENIVMRLWVDVNTNLPVRIEVDSVLINKIKANVVMFDPQWDVELEADFFEPKIPDNYITPEQRGYIGINLENWPTLKVIPGMATEKAGIKDGDIVLKINDNIISDVISSADAQNMLFGKIGEKVVLTVQRDEQILTYEIERAPLPE